MVSQLNIGLTEASEKWKISETEEWVCLRVFGFCKGLMVVVRKGCAIIESSKSIILDLKY